VGVAHARPDPVMVLLGSGAVPELLGENRVWRVRVDFSAAERADRERLGHDRECGGSPGCRRPPERGEARLPRRTRHEEGQPGHPDIGLAATPTPEGRAGEARPTGPRRPRRATSRSGPRRGQSQLRVASATPVRSIPGASKRHSACMLGSCVPGVPGTLVPCVPRGVPRTATTTHTSYERPGRV
jgi:hypothetical protein